MLISFVIFACEYVLLEYELILTHDHVSFDRRHRKITLVGTHGIYIITHPESRFSFFLLKI